MFGENNHGSQVALLGAGDVAIGVSGKPIRLFSATWLSDGTARNLVLTNGTADSDTVYVQQGGTISKTVTQNWEEGLLFPAGCFLDIGSVVSAVFEFRVEI